MLREIAAVDSRVTVVKLRRNFGQTAGLAAGFDHARGEYIIAMDGDLQHDPNDIRSFWQRSPPVTTSSVDCAKSASTISGCAVSLAYRQLDDGQDQRRRHPTTSAPPSRPTAATSASKRAALRRTALLHPGTSLMARRKHLRSRHPRTSTVSAEFRTTASRAPSAYSSIC